MYSVLRTTRLRVGIVQAVFAVPRRLSIELRVSSPYPGKMKMAVNDDELIRRKLLIEGHGGNDDRRLSSLLKTFIKWCSPADAESDDEGSNSTQQRMLSVLSQCELSTQKSMQVYEMNLLEQKGYEQLQKAIERKIQNAVEKISECKNELNRAKCIRRNRQEYDALAKVIEQHPDRQQTRRQLESLDEELESMKKTKEALEQKLELRKKQFHVLISAIHEMQRILEEDEQGAAEALEALDMDTT